MSLLNEAFRGADNKEVGNEIRGSKDMSISKYLYVLGVLFLLKSSL